MSIFITVTIVTDTGVALLGKQRDLERKGNKNQLEGNNGTKITTNVKIFQKKGNNKYATIVSKE